MLATVKQIFAPTNNDIRKKIGFTLLILIIFQIGTTILIPTSSMKNLDSGLGFLELLNAMSGGAMRRYSIFSLGVSPYITASIIVQLLQMDIIPYFSELSKQGEVGRQKINKITRYIGIIFAFIQGYAYAIAFTDVSNVTGSIAFEYLKVATILTAGTCFVLWLGDKITQKGVGNGISLIIMAGIISTVPQLFIDAWSGLVNFGTVSSTMIGIASFVAFVLVYIAIVLGVIYVQEAERRIPIQYANRTTSAYGGKQNFLPFKINSAGVMPVIFASTLISIPSVIAAFVKNKGFSDFIENYIAYTSPTGLILYMLLILFFAYFYTFIQIKPQELSENLQKNGGYIPGVRPGKETEKYITGILSKLTVVGAVFLMIIAGLPVVFSIFSKLGPNVTIGGTGLLIIVGVALETYRQIESNLVSRTYQRGRTR